MNRSLFRQSISICLMVSFLTSVSFGATKPDCGPFLLTPNQIAEKTIDARLNSVDGLLKSNLIKLFQHRLKKKIEAACPMSILCTQEKLNEMAASEMDSFVASLDHRISQGKWAIRTLALWSAAIGSAYFVSKGIRTLPVEFQPLAGFVTSMFIYKILAGMEIAASKIAQGAIRWQTGKSFLRDNFDTFEFQNRKIQVDSKLTGPQRDGLNREKGVTGELDTLSGIVDILNSISRTETLAERNEKLTGLAVKLATFSMDLKRYFPDFTPEDPVIKTRAAILVGEKILSDLYVEQLIERALRIISKYEKDPMTGLSDSKGMAYHRKLLRLVLIDAPAMAISQESNPQDLGPLKPN